MASEYERNKILQNSEECLKKRLAARNKARPKTPSEIDTDSRRRLHTKDTLAKTKEAQSKFLDKKTEQTTFAVVKTPKEE